MLRTTSHWQAIREYTSRGARSARVCHAREKEREAERQYAYSNESGQYTGRALT